MPGEMTLNHKPGDDRLFEPTITTAEGMCDGSKLLGEPASGPQIAERNPGNNTLLKLPA